MDAHPHPGDGGKLARIPHGIVENFGEARAEGEAGGIGQICDTGKEGWGRLGGGAR